MRSDWASSLFMTLVLRIPQRHASPKIEQHVMLSEEKGEVLSCSLTETRAFFKVGHPPMTSRTASKECA